MASTSLKSIFDVGADILGTALGNNNSISAQIGDSIGNEVRCDNAAFWQHIGFASRPASAIAGKSSAQVIAIETGDRDICIASRDTRGQAIYGALKPGETSVYAGGPSNTGTGRILLKDDGSISTLSMLTQKGNTSSGNPIIIQVSSEGKITLANEDKATLVMDQDGFKVASTGVIQLGASGALTLIGSTLGLNAGSVSLGANASQPVALAPALIAWAAQVVTACASAPGGPIVIPPLSATVASTSVKAAA